MRRLTAGTLGFLTFTQCGTRPERYSERSAYSQHSQQSLLTQINVFRLQATKLSNRIRTTEANMFASRHTAKGFAAALMLTLIGSASALAQPSSAAPIEYLRYDLTPYFNLMMSSAPAYQYWRPNSEVESTYSGLFDYAPGAVVHASPMVEDAYLPHIGVPYIGYDLTPYYNLAPGCPLSSGPISIC